MKPHYKALLALALLGVIALCFYPFASLFHSNPDTPNDTLVLLTALGGLAAAIVSSIAIHRVITSRPLGLPFLIIIPAFVLLAVSTIVGQTYQTANADCFTPQSGYDYATDYIGDGNGHFCRIKPVADTPIPPFILTVGIMFILTTVVTGPTLLIATLLDRSQKHTSKP